MLSELVALRTTSGQHDHHQTTERTGALPGLRREGARLRGLSERAGADLRCNLADLAQHVEPDQVVAAFGTMALAPLTRILGAARHLCARLLDGRLLHPEVQDKPFSRDPAVDHAHAPPADPRSTLSDLNNPCERVSWRCLACRGQLLSSPAMRGDGRSPGSPLRSCRSGSAQRHLRTS